MLKFDQNVEDTLNVEDTISSTSEIPSTSNEQIRAQITSDTGNVEDVEDVEDTMQTTKEEAPLKNLQEIEFVPISSLFKEDNDKVKNPLLEMEKPTGATYNCPNCNKLQYSHDWELHKESCSSLRNLD